VCAESPGAARPPEVQPCREEDLTAIHEILLAAPEAAPWSAQGLKGSVNSYPEYSLVAWKDKGITGFIAGRQAADEGEILNLAVKTTYRRQGIGQALVRALLQAFVGHGVARVFLEVRESNAAAIAFYGKLAFREVGRREGYYREPEETALVLALARDS
jgi:ribosomal-protein-alanine N-acetyltransferase